MSYKRCRKCQQNAQSKIRKGACGTNKDEIILEKAHRIERARIEPDGRRMPRSLVAKFLSYKLKEEIRRNANLLKGTNYFISEQFPKEVMESRKQKIPVMKKAKEEENKVNVVADKLFINGVFYKPSE